MNDRLVPVNYDEPTHALRRVSERVFGSKSLDEMGMRGGAYLESEPSLNVGGWRARGDEKQRIPLGLAFPLFGRTKGQSPSPLPKANQTELQRMGWWSIAVTHSFVFVVQQLSVLDLKVAFLPLLPATSAGTGRCK
jgi:hypothetical protein